MKKLYGTQKSKDKYLVIHKKCIEQQKVVLSFSKLFSELTMAQKNSNFSDKLVSFVGVCLGVTWSRMPVYSIKAANTNTMQAITQASIAVRPSA